MLMRPSCGAATSVAARGRTSTVTLDLTATSLAIKVKTCRPAGSETWGEAWPRASSLPRQSTSTGYAETTLTLPSGRAGAGATASAPGDAAGPAVVVLRPAAPGVAATRGGGGRGRARRRRRRGTPAQERQGRYRDDQPRGGDRDRRERPPGVRIRPQYRRLHH